MRLLSVHSHECKLNIILMRTICVYAYAIILEIKKRDCFDDCRDTHNGEMLLVLSVIENKYSLAIAKSRIDLLSAIRIIDKIRFRI